MMWENNEPSGRTNSSSAPSVSFTDSKHTVPSGSR